LFKQYLVSENNYPNQLPAIDWWEAANFLTGIGRLLVVAGELLIQFGQVIYRILYR
jgi:hypothetical protein